LSVGALGRNPCLVHWGATLAGTILFRNAVGIELQQSTGAEGADFNEQHANA
jgi:hypothetical protein